MTASQIFAAIAASPGDGAAWRLLSDLCTTISRRNGVVPAHAEDACARVLLELQIELADNRWLVPDHPEAWLHKRLRNRSIDLHRKAQRKPPVLRGATGVASSPAIDRESVLRDLDELVPFVEAERSERHDDALARAWGGLRLKFAEELTNRELVSRLGASISMDALFQSQTRLRGAMHVVVQARQALPANHKHHLHADEAQRLHGLIDLLRGRKRGPVRGNSP